MLVSLLGSPPATIVTPPSTMPAAPDVAAGSDPRSCHAPVAGSKQSIWALVDGSRPPATHATAPSR